MQAPAGALCDHRCPRRRGGAGLLPCSLGCWPAGLCIGEGILAAARGTLRGTRPFLRPQVKFEMSENTTLADLLQLNLHKYEDEVRNIVDKAVKESGMEKVPSGRRVLSGAGSCATCRMSHFTGPALT